MTAFAPAPGSVAEALLEEADSVLASWDARRQRDSGLGSADEIDSPRQVLESLANALDRPQPIDGGPDEVIPRLATQLAETDALLTVTARQLLHLREAIFEFVPPLSVAELLEVRDRTDVLVTWLVTQIAAVRIRGIALDALRYPLTGLWSKVRFLDDLATALGDVSASSEEVVLVVAMDLDGFKRINDARGHQEGDEVLRRFAAGLADAVGTQGTAYHLSGDEFALILKSGDPGSITARAEAAAGVTCSCGVVTIGPADASATPQEIHERADLALLRRKRAKKGWLARLLPSWSGGRR